MLDGIMKGIAVLLYVLSVLIVLSGVIWHCCTHSWVAFYYICSGAGCFALGTIIVGLGMLGIFESQEPVRN